MLGASEHKACNKQGARYTVLYDGWNGAFGRMESVCLWSVGGAKTLYFK